MALAGLSALTGCATSPASTKTAPLPEVGTLLIFNGETGDQVAWESMMEDVNASDLVVIGELHGHPVGLHAAATIWDELAANHESAALSMEFFERDEQVGLDDYINGVLDTEKFRKATRRSGGNYPPGHERMIETARELGRTVVAANSPRRYNSLANQEGYDRLRGLSAEQQRLFVIPDSLPEGRYRDEFYEIMSGMFAIHGDPPPAAEDDAAEEADTGDADDEAEMIEEEVPQEQPATQPDAATTQPDVPTSQQADEEAEDALSDDEDRDADDEDEEEEELILTPEQEESIASMFRSQCMWDSTMTDSVLKAADAGHRPVVHVVGQFHVNFGGGIPIRLAALAPELRMITICVSSEWSDSLTEDDEGKADYVIYVGPAE